MKTTWNEMTILARKKLLTEAGYAPNLYAFRAFDYIPSWVRLDVEYTFNRAKNKAKYSEIRA
jgi:hypothetical protein